MYLLSSARLSYRLLCTGTVLALACLASHAADGGKLYKAQCVACHGANGSGNAAQFAPPLAGNDQDYLVRQLRNFRSQVRGGDAPQGPAAVMQAIAQSIPDDASAVALARYISTFKPPLRAQAVPPPPGSALNAGKTVFAICVACHGSHGEGAPALKAPPIAQLPAWYITAQLESFQDGRRGAHPDDPEGRQMRQIVTELQLDEEAVRALGAYITAFGVKPR